MDILTNNIENIIYITIVIISLLGFIISVIKAIKNSKNLSLLETISEIENLAITKISEIEKLYSRASNVLNSIGVKTGDIKKENVMSYIKTICSKNKIEFDEEYWSVQIEKLVSLMNTNKHE